MVTLSELPGSRIESDYETNPTCAYEIRKATHNRENVLDLLELFWRKARQAHIVCDVDMSSVERQRAKLLASNYHLTVTSFVLKAICMAQVSHPISRTMRLPFGRLFTLNSIVAGFTVERIVKGEPVVFFGKIENPHNKPLIEIAEELKQYSDAPIEQVSELRRQRQFTGLNWFLRRFIFVLGIFCPPIRLTCNSATFGLSSLGALGVEMVLGPSVCTSVFGLGLVESRPVVRNGKIEIRPIMTVSLNYDNNIMDNEQAVRFLSDVRELLEDGLDENE
ncbi:MAG: 2-oxo acid dehydrogenase subunit E2 [Candidatus Obscuribacterales bacterium]|nr:2-oxo acid dehydrogenase subunit E2 [Candidatus Obscuribacterales bacterium]